VSSSHQGSSAVCLGSLGGSRTRSMLYAPGVLQGRFIAATAACLEDLLSFLPLQLWKGLFIALTAACLEDLLSFLPLQPLKAASSAC